MIPELLADLRAIRPWLYGATALLYVAVALRMLTVGLVGRYPWFWAYLLLQGLAVAPWGLVYDKPAMEPLVLRDPALWFLRGMAIFECAWRTSHRRLIAIGVAVAGLAAGLWIGSLLPDYPEVANYFPSIARWRLRASLALALSAFLAWQVAAADHSLLLLIYCSLYALLAVNDYRVFREADWSLPRAIAIYSGLLPFVALRASCLLIWLRVMK